MAERASYDVERRHDGFGELVRFTVAERWVHRSLAALMAVMIATAAILYFGEFAVLVGRRALVADIHIYAGMALPVPILLGLLSRAFRQDLGRLNRFLPVDQVWLRSKNRRVGRLPVGKFNAGQKLYAAFLSGAILVMLGTGLVMRYANGWPIELRTGATFVHDWLSYALTIAVIGHMYFAMRDPTARRGLRTGSVPEDWARIEHRQWAEDMTGETRRNTRTT